MNTENEEDLLEKVTNHFDVKDKYESFEVKYGCDLKDNEEGKVHFTLHGLKRELGQTLNSTGLTMWRAAFHLCARNRQVHIWTFQPTNTYRLCTQRNE